jgi:hypothetical protein
MPPTPMPDPLQLTPSVLRCPRDTAALVVDTDGMLVAWTAGAESLLALTAERVLGYPLGTVPLARVAFWEAVAEIAGVTGVAQRIRGFEIVRGPQAGAHLDLTFHPLVSQTGTRDGVLIRVEEAPEGARAIPEIVPRDTAVEDGVAEARRRVRSEQRKLRARIARVEAEAGEIESLAGALLERGAMLERTSAAFQGLDAAARAIAAGKEPSQVLAEVCSRACHLLAGDFAAVGLREPDGALRWFGPGGEFSGGPPATSTLADACRRVIAFGEPLALEVPLSRGSPEGLRAAVMAPLGGGAPAGVLLCAWREERVPSLSEIWIAEALAARAGDALRRP